MPNAGMDGWAMACLHHHIDGFDDAVNTNSAKRSFCSEIGWDPLVLQVWKRYAGTQRMGTCRDPVRARVMVRSPPEVRKASWKP